MGKLRFENNIIPANVEKTLGKLYFSMAIEPRVDPDSGEMYDRRYDLLSEGQEDTITVTIPASEPALVANYQDEVVLENVELKAWAYLQGGAYNADSDVKITADRIKVKGSTQAPPASTGNQASSAPQKEDKKN